MLLPVLIAYLYLLSIATDMTVEVLQTSDYSPKFVFDEYDRGVNALAWSYSSKYLASCSDDKTIRVWNVENVRFPY